MLKESIKDFMNIIAPHMAPSMKYKLVMTLETDPASAGESVPTAGR